MKFTARLRKAVVAFRKALTLSGVDSNRGWVTLFRSGLGWQTDTKYKQDDIIKFVPVYSCATLIASDIAKVTLRLMTQEEGVWVETTSPAFSPVLKKPNHYQTRQQFVETWVVSKLLHGNAYVLKVRDARNVVVALFVLDPNRVTPLVAPNGAIYYQLQRDDLSKLPMDLPAVPASEIIHDRMECLFHPLVGVTPLMAANLAASQGLRMQENSEKFFKNMSRPSGILTSAHEIDDEDAKALKEDWEKNFSGENAGRVAVIGNDVKYIGLSVNAEDAQLVEQLKLTAEQICSAFHVPAFLVGAGPVPSYDNVQALNQQYHSQCLHKLFNAIEDLLDDGLGLSANGSNYRCEFDLADLLRMDSKTLAETEGIKVQRGISAPNESRRLFGLKPVKGGNAPFLQEQNWPIEILAGRDTPRSEPTPPAATPTDEPEQDDTDKALHLLFRKSPEELIHA